MVGECGQVAACRAVVVHCTHDFGGSEENTHGEGEGPDPARVETSTLRTLREARPHPLRGDTMLRACNEAALVAADRAALLVWIVVRSREVEGRYVSHVANKTRLHLALACEPASYKLQGVGLHC